MFNTSNFKLLFSKGEWTLDKKDIPKSGIYLIIGLILSSRFINTIYTGSSINLKERFFHGHLNELEKNTHDNPLLQNYYNKHGIENLEIYLIEECEKSQTLIREQYYLDLWRPFADEGRGFNISHFATAPMKDRKHSKKTLTQMSEKQKGENHPMFGKPRSEETKKKLSIANLGKKHTPETCKKLSKIVKNRKHSEESIRRMSEYKTGDKNPNWGKFGINNSNFGKKRSEEICKRISEIQIGRVLSEEHKIISRLVIGVK